MIQLVESNSGPLEARREAFASALLGRLKEVVDRGDADDPGSVSSNLDVPLVKTRSWDEINKHCPQDVERAKEEEGQLGFRDFAAPAKSWVNANRLGRPGFKVPGVLINRPYTIARHANLTYDLGRSVLCAQAEPIKEWLIESTLAIENLPALVCLGQQEISQLILGAEREIATDGISAIVYEKPGDTAPVRSGSRVTRLEFIFQANSACATSLYLRTAHQLEVAQLAALWSK